MDNLILSAGVVLPLFLMMALGYALRRMSLVDAHTLSGLNKLVFRVFLPVMLFKNIYDTNLSDSFEPKLMAFAVCSILLLFMLTMVIVPLLEKENPKRATMVQAIYRSNFILFGLPITTALFGPEKAGVAAILISVTIPLFNIFAVVALEFFRGGRFDGKKALMGIVTNPLIIASFLGIIFLLCGIRLPKPVMSAISDVGKAATPMALLVLGGTFKFSAVSGSLRQLIICVIGKLIVSPGLFLTLAVFFGFRGVELAAILSLFASPTATSSYPMAVEMDADGELAGQVVVLGSLFSVFTMFFWVFILKQLMLI